MANLPTGTVTFLFTDIEGSTALWEHDRDAMQAALEQHDALLRAAIESRGGHVFKTVGDAFCAAFPRANDALEAAIATQRAVSGSDWSALGEAGPLRIRIGLHTGEASERDGDYYGPPVNRVARLEAAGHGGQLFLSLATQQIVRDALPDGCSLHDWGEHRLKDLRHSEHIFQLKGPDLPQVDTRPTTAEAMHPRDRVRVVETDDEAARADDESAWSRLEAAVLSDEGEAVTLTPSEALRLAIHKPADLREYRLGRIAEWSQPRYRLDGRFVGLTLLMDQGEEHEQGRWQSFDEPYNDLQVLLAETIEPAIVVLGPPGAGKSTLLRRLELDSAIRGLRGEEEGRVTFLVCLNAYKPDGPSQALLSPAQWLIETWKAKYPRLPALESLIEAGQVTFLIDALNEIPAASESDFHDLVQLWKGWLVKLAGEHPGNRFVFSCRTLDYSQSLSTPDLRVPQARIEPLIDEQVQRFLTIYSPGHWRQIWSSFKSSSRRMNVLRSPYFLALLVDQVESTGEMPEGRAALFTSFVRQALRREVERGSSLFRPGWLLSSRDLKRLAGWKWKNAYDLPERGVLIPKLAMLAHSMQAARSDGERSQVRVGIDDALAMLGDSRDQAILSAGEALAVLDEDQASEELMYVHQLVQEYFAARRLVEEPNQEVVRKEWRVEQITPGVDEVIAGLHRTEVLPFLPATGWEQTTLLSAAITASPDEFLRALMDANLALAGRAAAQVDLMSRLSDELLFDLRWALVARSRSVEVDLRDRIACGLTVGELGDPRFEEVEGPFGKYLKPVLVTIPAGRYSIGSDQPIRWEFETDKEDLVEGRGQFVSHMPRHTVELPKFQIGQFPVTNREWGYFIDADGYHDETWWDTKDSRRWLRGEIVGPRGKQTLRLLRKRLLQRPGLLEKMQEEGRLPAPDSYAQWALWIRLDDQGFEDAIDAHLRSTAKRHQPYGWNLERYNHPSQPVVGINWYEARSYCNWLSAQMEGSVRLPTEVEFESATGNRDGQFYPWENVDKPSLMNTYETQLRRPSPIGVFPESDAVTHVADLAGNVSNWTSSLFGTTDDSDSDEPDYKYPYEAADGREDPLAPANLQRVVRGGAWRQMRAVASVVRRESGYPASASPSMGVRVVCESP